MDATCTHHTWTTVDTGFACEDCTETAPACHTCGERPAVPNAACDRCINRARQTLADIRLALDHPMAPILPLRAIRYDKHRGSSGNHMPFGIGTELDDPDILRAEMARTSRTVLELTRNPDTLTDTLAEWAEAWAEARSEQTPADWLDYLNTRTIWAANTPHASGWHDYHQEARTIRTRLWNLVGLNPQHEIIPCPYCGSTLLRHWTDHGLADQIRCTNRDCERGTYRNEADLLWVASTAIRQAPDLNPGMLVTREDARRIHPDLKRKTLNLWINRGHIPARGKNTRGEDLYRLTDITTRMQGSDT